MDLVSCRNLLIYLEAGAQKKVLPAFHYALKPEGSVSDWKKSSIVRCAPPVGPDKDQRSARQQTRTREL